jgi:uncharacterized membrane protein YbaN (DUF454 family)
MHPPDPEAPSPTHHPGNPSTVSIEPSHRTRAGLPLRAILVAVGTVSLVVGVLGIVVPVLPTTPFLLLTAACYARASDRLYAWLIGRPSLGPIITEWRSSRSLPPGVRMRAVAVVALSFGASIILADALAIKVALAITGLAVGVFLYRIPTRT